MGSRGGPRRGPMRWRRFVAAVGVAEGEELARAADRARRQDLRLQQRRWTGERTTRQPARKARRRGPRPYAFRKPPGR